LTNIISDIILEAAVQTKDLHCGLLLFTHGKSHMGFRLVPKVMTLNDLKQRFVRRSLSKGQRQSAMTAIEILWMQ